MEAVREYCDRAILIEDSHLILSGDPDKVASRYVRLFNVAPDDTDDDKGGERRWGDKRVQFTRAEIVPAKIDDSKKEALLKVEFAAHEIAKNLVVGFRLKSKNGQSLLGTNTKIERITIPSVSKGDIRQLTYHIPNILSEGNFDIDIAIESDGGGTVCDWWEDALTLSVRRQNKSHYIVSPKIKVDENNP